MWLTGWLAGWLVVCGRLEVRVPVQLVGDRSLSADRCVRWRCDLRSWRLAGIGLDGRGLYGQFEGVNNQMPVLDACGGHWGPTPASTFTDKAGHTITVSAQTNGYHYHIVAGGIVCCSL